MSQKLNTFLSEKIEDIIRVKNLFSSEVLSQTFLFDDKAFLCRNNIFESEHRQISDKNPNLAGIYFIERVGDLVTNFTMNIDTHVKKIMLSIGDCIIWEKIPTEEYKEGKIFIGVEAKIIPIFLLKYYKISVTIITDHTSRNALYDSKYSLEYDDIKISEKIIMEISGKSWKIDYGLKINENYVLV